MNFSYSAENSENLRKPHQAVDKFIKRLSVIPIYGVVQEYAEQKVKLRRNETPMHDEFDFVIGVTDNTKDFRYIDGLSIENWFRS